MNDKQPPPLVPGQPICKRPRSAAGIAPTAPMGGSGMEQGYLKKHCKAGTPMVVALNCGTTIQGRIAWIDANSVKIERKLEAPNVLIYKTAIAYIYRAGTAAE